MVSLRWRDPHCKSNVCAAAVFVLPQEKKETEIRSNWCKASVQERKNRISWSVLTLTLSLNGGLLLPVITLLTCHTNKRGDFTCVHSAEVKKNSCFPTLTRVLRSRLFCSRWNYSNRRFKNLFPLSNSRGRCLWATAGEDPEVQVWTRQWITERKIKGSICFFYIFSSADSNFNQLQFILLPPDGAVDVSTCYTCPPQRLEPDSMMAWWRGL